ncbi:efflux RND transporter periplasmic adaptor subunit [Desulfovibrio sp. OttesenSCG-928-G11]|nr:efflux RND transporter periplasmic adaptor subunit [Desulfovibrio sp. OttesenSCG-928-G11]
MMIARKASDAFFPAAALFLALLAGCAFCPAPALADAEDAGHNGKVYCPLIFYESMHYAGLVEEVMVAPGDKVEAGQALARYRLKDESALEIFEYLDENELLQTPFSSLADTSIKLFTQAEELTAAKRLSGAGMGSGERLKRLQESVAILREYRDLLKTRLTLNKKIYGHRKIVVNRKLGHVPESGEVPEFGYIRSRAGGEVLVVHSDLRPDMLLDDGLEEAITLGRTNPMEVQTKVFEGDVAGLEIGGKAKVKIMSLKEREYDGVITYINRSSEDMDPDRPSYYALRLTIPNDDGELRAGFKAIVHFVRDNPKK